MGVVHHSNYLRWMEEARTFFFDENDLAYVVTESLGVLCPITEANINFKFPARYGDTFTIELELTKYTGVRFNVKYTIKNQTGDILVEAGTCHAFINKDFKPVSLAHAIPERHELMKKLI